MLLKMFQSAVHTVGICGEKHVKRGPKVFPSGLFCTVQSSCPGRKAGSLAVVAVERAVGKRVAAAVGRRIAANMQRAVRHMPRPIAVREAIALSRFFSNSSSLGGRYGPAAKSVPLSALGLYVGVEVEG